MDQVLFYCNLSSFPVLSCASLICLIASLLNFLVETIVGWGIFFVDVSSVTFFFRLLEIGTILLCTAQRRGRSSSSSAVVEGGTVLGFVKLWFRGL